MINSTRYRWWSRDTVVNKIVPCITAKLEKVNKFKMTNHDKCCEGNERTVKETEGKVGNLLVIGPILPPRFRCRTRRSGWHPVDNKASIMC